MRPAGLVLAYPVITSGEYAHAGSMRNLLGEKYGDAALTELVSLEKQVSAETPPTFIWVHGHGRRRARGEHAPVRVCAAAAQS